MFPTIAKDAVQRWMKKWNDEYMRIIDADEVVKFYKNMGKEFPELSAGVHFSIADIISNLDNIPTVKRSRKMTMTNAEWMIKNGYNFMDLDAVLIDPLRGREITLNGKTIDWNPCNSRVNAIRAWLDMEHKEPILDDAEKRYLKGVIRPFRDRVEYIKKIDCACEEYIHIQLNKDWTILPHFRTGTMYKGMKPDHAYTLEELGL